MIVVVSANYRDRSQKNWLVRKADESIDNYELRERVCIKNFRFCESYSGEQGFGCNIVGCGELVEESEINREKLVRILFGGLKFREAESGVSIERGAALVLDDTGMYYLPA